MPVPFPSRRQIIDADKGTACLQCHRMPYPTAPQRGLGPSSIPTVHPGGWRLLTTRPHPFDKTAAAWSPDGRRIVYSVNLYKDEWDIWVMETFT